MGVALKAKLSKIFAELVLLPEDRRKDILDDVAKEHDLCLKCAGINCHGWCDFAGTVF